ncbi:LysR family transcriptional regulator [Nocardia tengchongensis]|uniref:LysR family transcriptional regulator n=1 Tax=Nocardia tengchongensis TaxID=2055889 RepID=UPI0036B294F8
MDISLTHLKTLVAVVDAGGFGAAAAELGVSQSAVSHTIAALERLSGQPVVTREFPITPTALGQCILEHARVAVAAATAAQGVLRGRTGVPFGSITLAAPPTACHALLPDLLSAWEVELPRVRVVVLEGEDAEVAGWLGDATADAAVLVDPPEAPTRAVLLARDTFCAAMRRDHPLATETVVDIADLTDDPLLLSTGGCEPHIRELHRRARSEFRPTHRVRQLSTLFSMVRAGIGVTVVPESAAGMEGDDLVLVPIKHNLERSLYLCGPSDRPWHPAVAHMVDTARSRTRPAQQPPSPRHHSSRSVPQRARTQTNDLPVADP